MCGIVGYSGQFTRDVLEEAVRRISHRGPDDSGIFLANERGVGLGHTRLSILDVSPLGHQPMLSDDGTVALVFNGEIYNFQELRKELEAAGHRFRGHSDTEVLLRLYLSEGEAMLSRLNGIFAFALWDSRRGELLVTRDALGVKPLYYTAIEGRFAFASEIKALGELIPLEGELDCDAINRYLTFLWCPGDGTPVKSVRKINPGEALWIRDGEVKRRFTWYQLPTFRRTTSMVASKDLVAGTVHHLRQAVHRQMVADVPVGAFLSGGLDSSSVVAFAREINPDIRCFTIELSGGQDSGVTDDLPYAKEVATHLKVPLEVVHVDAARMAMDLEEMVFKLDEPLADPACLNVLYISRLAQESGIKVLLSGAGGDDLFTGYRRHRAIQLDRYWTWLPMAIRSHIERMTLNLDKKQPLLRRLSKLFSGAALDGDARLVNYFRWNRRTDLEALFTPAFRAALTESSAEAPMLEFLSRLPPSVKPLERMLALEQRFFLADHNLVYTDKMSMAVGVETRVPFLDLDLLDFADRIPMKYKQRGNEGKWVLKKAMEPYLPHDVIYRPKTGFGAPLRMWMRFELRELLGDLLSSESLTRRGVFDPHAVQRLILGNDSGRIDASYTLLSLLCIEIWCRRFVDQSATKKRMELPHD
jgi:asparagine synthase (glutamine-hydrolysing)